MFQIRGLATKVAEPQKDVASFEARCDLNNNIEEVLRSVDS